MGRPAEYGVILAGGGGTRLWPSSRRARPKQLLRLGGSESLLAATHRRIRPLFRPDRILVVTVRDQHRAVRSELPQVPAENILVEPEPRNTAGAIGIAAAWAILKTGRESRLAVLPADHHISNERSFRAVARQALSAAAGAIVTIGIRPTQAETGYGYIRLGRAAGRTRPGIREVAAFVEKPDQATALRYLRSGKYLWNSGMFFFSAGHLLDEIGRQLPGLHRLLTRLTRLEGLRGFPAAVRRHYHEAESISIDYGVIQRAAPLHVVPARFGWSDVGSWSALADRAAGDKDGNVLIGDVLLRDGTGNIVISDPGGPFLGVVGVHGLVVVAAPDGVLVIPRDRAQDVRQVVDALKRAKRTELVDRAPAPRRASLPDRGHKRDHP